jgi:hypothetical protein
MNGPNTSAPPATPAPTQNLNQIVSSISVRFTDACLFASTVPDDSSAKLLPIDLFLISLFTTSSYSLSIPKHSPLTNLYACHPLLYHHLVYTVPF